MLKFEWMQIVLALGLVAILVSFWRAHRTPGFEFNAFDLIMEKGKVDSEKTVFMVLFVVMTWAFINKELHGTLAEGFYTSYGAMWAAPLILKRFSNKNDPAGSTTTTTIKQEITEKAMP